MPEASTVSVPAPRPSWLYRLVFGAAAVVAAILLAFFFIGLADGTVSSFNIGLWLAILAGVTAILALGRSLHRGGHTKSALALLGLLAVPGVLYGLLIVLFVASGTRWN